ncbi:MAG: YHYH protein [Verrucomicrobiae bacterium]|nr:YHYH protein [Verrucomicrobiae bacterium]
MNRILPSILLAAALAFSANAQPRPSGGRGPGPERQPQFNAPAGSYSNQVSLRISGQYRYITANGIPDHEPGQFPRHGNPNTIRPQRHSYRLPMNPGTNRVATPVQMMPFGIALNGVPFDPNAAEFWRNDFNSGWQYEAKGGSIDLGLDEHNAHVQPTGAYHYHAMPIGLARRLFSDDKMVLVGYAADGFPIYARYGPSNPADPASELTEMKSSFRIKKGIRPGGPGGTYDGSFIQDYEYVAGAGDLDECNGRYGPTPEYPKGVYHYFITDDWPYLPRNFRGTPDDSFKRRGPPPGGRGGPPGGGPGRSRGGPPGGPKRGF